VVNSGNEPSQQAASGTPPALVVAALQYAKAGIPVFPIEPRGKRPAIKGGFYSATTNPETIKRLWRIADRNVAIPTGISSGIWALDVDPGGAEALCHLEAKYCLLPLTRTVITPRGGRHLWFKYTGPVPSTAGRIGHCIDARGDGGYIIAVPSIGANGRPYLWADDPEIAQNELAEAPEWLLALARKKADDFGARACQRSAL
jgi:Bifunctional DNA primase/polymerase, N-terminal